jgi:hypothetical protein
MLELIQQELGSQLTHQLELIQHLQLGLELVLLLELKLRKELMEQRMDQLE